MYNVGALISHVLRRQTYPHIPLAINNTREWEGEREGGDIWVCNGERVGRGGEGGRREGGREG